MTTIYKGPQKAGGKAFAFPPAPYPMHFKFFAVLFTPPYDGQEKKSSASLPF